MENPVILLRHRNINKNTMPTKCTSHQQISYALCSPVSKLTRKTQGNKFVQILKLRILGKYYKRWKYVKNGKR